MIKIGTDQKEFGPLKPGFTFDLEEGYQVLVGENNSGKSAIIQLIFKKLAREISEFDLNKVCLVLPERNFVDISTETGTRTLENHNVELSNAMSRTILNYSTYQSPPKSELPKLLLTHDNFMDQVTKLSLYLEKLNLPRPVIGQAQHMRFEDIEIVFQGSGLRALLPILAGLTDPRLEVLLIDEPELSLEPRIQKNLRDLLYESSNEKRIVVATQSHLFLNRKNLKSNTIVKNTNEGVSVSNISSEQELFELVFNLLGSSLGDLFFPENFIIVEGSADQIIVERILDIKGIDKKKIKVVSATGVANIKNTKKAIEETLKPVIITKSPYKDRVVCLIDKRNSSNSEIVKKLKKTLKDRLIELKTESIEDYIPPALYKKVGRGKKQDSIELNRLKTNFDESAKIKKQISTEISKVINKKDLKTLPELDDLVEKSVSSV